MITATEVNSDGRSNGLTAPNAAAQRALLAHAHGPDGGGWTTSRRTAPAPARRPRRGRGAGRGPRTGPPRRTALLLGSVKTNIGHLEAAAGIAGLIKTVLALHHDELPGQLHFAEPNPHIDLDALRLRVLTAPEPWPRYSGTATAGVSAFGFSGTNAHVVLREHRPRGRGARATAPQPSPAPPASAVLFPHPKPATPRADPSRAPGTPRSRTREECRGPGTGGPTETAGGPVHRSGAVPAPEAGDPARGSVAGAREPRGPVGAEECRGPGTGGPTETAGGPVHRSGAVPAPEAGDPARGPDAGAGNPAVPYAGTAVAALGPAVRRNRPAASFTGQEFGRPGRPAATGTRRPALVLLDAPTDGRLRAHAGELARWLDSPAGRGARPADVGRTLVTAPAAAGGAPPSSPATGTPSPPPCTVSPWATRTPTSSPPTVPRSPPTTRARCGSSPDTAPSGPAWAANCSRRNRRSPPPSSGSNRCCASRRASLCSARRNPTPTSPPHRRHAGPLRPPGRPRRTLALLRRRTLGGDRPLAGRDRGGGHGRRPGRADRGTDRGLPVPAPDHRAWRHHGRRRPAPAGPRPDDGGPADPARRGVRVAGAVRRHRFGAGGRRAGRPGHRRGRLRQDHAGAGGGTLAGRRPCWTRSPGNWAPSRTATPYAGATPRCWTTPRRGPLRHRLLAGQPAPPGPLRAGGARGRAGRTPRVRGGRPHPTQAHPLARTLEAAGADEALVVPTLRRGTDDATSFRTALATLLVHGARVPSARETLHPDGRITDVPPPRWQHRRYWAGEVVLPLPAPESRPAAATRLDRLRMLVARVMGFAPDRLDPDVPLTDLGLDSLTAVRIRTAVLGEFGSAPELGVLLRQGTLRGVAGLLDDAPAPSPAPPLPGNPCTARPESCARSPEPDRTRPCSWRTPPAAPPTCTATWPRAWTDTGRCTDSTGWNTRTTCPPGPPSSPAGSGRSGPRAPGPSAAGRTAESSPRRRPGC